ncbi:retrovirus-related pol polyprotein from transposon TNT 1-94, partial [Tanacetum coccineum]
GPTLQEQVEAILRNKGLLFVTTAKGKDTCPNNALNLKGNEMIPDLRIMCCWCKLNVKVVLMVNLSHYGSDALAEVHNLDNMDNNMINQGFQNPFYLKKAQQLEPKLYDGNIIKSTSAIMIPDFEETLMLAEESCSKMLLKQQDPMVLEKKNSMNSSYPSPSCRPTKVEFPKEIPKVSMVNTSLKKLKHHLAGFDMVIKERTTATTITDGSWGDISVSNQSAPNFDQYFKLNELKAQSQEKDTVIKKLKERIKSLSGNINEDKEKGLVITALKDELRKLKGKDLADNVVTKHTIAPEMLKIDVEPIAPRLLNNRTAHSDYLRHTQEQAAILREIVEQGKSQNPLNNSLDSACKYTKRIQELLIIIRQTCPSINNSSDKLVVVTPKNKDKRVRFTEPVTSSGNTNTKTASSSNLVSNKPMLSSTGVKPSTSASGSQPSGNTKKDKIQQTPRTANVQHSKLNANSELKCVKCNGCMLFDSHDLCVLDFINNVNARVKSKSAKKNSRENFGNQQESDSDGVPHPIIASCQRPQETSLGSAPTSSSSELVKEEAPDFLIKVSQDDSKLRLKVRPYEKVGISHERSVARSPQQNGVVEIHNCTLIEAARTMLIYAKALLFLWEEAVATACYTQNRSIIRLRHGSEFGSEVTLPAGSELKTSELDTRELKTSQYRFLKIFILTSYEQELCKENGVNILKSIDEEPFQMGTFQETLAEGTC